MSISYTPGQGYKTLKEIRRGIKQRLGGTSENELEVPQVDSPENENDTTAKELTKQMLAQSASAGNYGIPQQGGSLASPSTMDFNPKGIQPLQPLGTEGASNSDLMEYMQTRGSEGGGGASEPKFNSNLERFLADAPGSVTIYSGKRDTGRQTELWKKALEKYGDESIARKWVAPPTGWRMSDGSIAKGSKHERGIAADLKFENDAVKRWVHENAGKYGLHFPLDNEPWHIEIIGSRG